MDPLFPLAALALGGAVGVALAGFRDPKANEHDVHDVSDYREPYAHTDANVTAPDETDPDTTGGFRALPASALRRDDDILPPAPPGMNAGSPLYAGMLFDTWLRERWGSTNPDAIAARMLRESAAEVVAAR